jgi:hypothetical protein
LTYCLEFCRCLGEVLLPMSNIFPHRHREISVIMKEIGMDYQAIDACPNDHIIYYGQYALENECPQCKISRFRTDKASKKVSHKVLRYIPIIPRFQQLFRCQSISQFMDFHAKNKSQEDVLRILVDGFALKYIKEKWPIFKEEHRNVRISLATDGVNPFGELRSMYSVWHVFVINNNLPPWMSIKREHTMLAMIVPCI